ncbi:NUBPL iron-transfer P-loop NTPase [Candidatus Megaera venefica]|uniref:Iron-sulfur cluster carrier protein n=1 Tax=Candidatus Megaera venefica TaxID=2055910 RepID=A0ABU5NAD1_9RICK|nr:Mrp/NBP35 family ATP-binding protein [Candidatus Megaera venefica]MEA0970118.1 NUBPL iron-transfer P-loop NTPase [Candidatus Megaera venefica]
MTITKSNRINEIRANLLLSDGTTVQSRSSDIIVNGSNVGFSLDISGIELAEAESIRAQIIKAIQETTDFEKISVVLTSTRKNQSASNEKAKIQIEGVGKVLLVASGKGGVGKSMIASLLAHKLKADGKKVGIVDADIYGPSIPHLFSLKGKPELDDNKMVPLENYGIVVNSIGFLTEPSASISWRGPMVSKAIYQLLSLTNWGKLDYLIIDSPPGTGDIHLSILQNYIIDQVIMVTTPQKISEIDVSRAVSLYKKFNVPILGVIENMSYYVIPKTGESISIFTGDGGNKIASDHNLDLLTKLPIDPRISIACDAGADLSQFSYLLDTIKLP